jgi:glycosyltransferase involved in cell wall biosynthesis
MTKRLPLVSIVTPIYNEAEYLSECIESVLNQSYTNWDYTVVDNCSTDASAEIARKYAARDSRIRIVQNHSFLEVIKNHNAALQQISAESKYCKVLFGDDWMFPRCLEHMVSLAEEQPSVGIVGAYSLQGNSVMWSGLPYPSRRIPGREICRRLFLEGLYVFGSAATLLYRSDLVRRHNPFYNESNFHADSEACIVLLKDSDFGFLHEVLTFQRVRLTSLTTFSSDINTYSRQTARTDAAR